MVQNVKRLAPLVAAVVFTSIAFAAAGSGPPKCFGLRATIVARKGQEVVRGTKRSDVIVGTRRRDVIRGRGGNDVVCARGGNDVVLGGRGTDTLLGHAGDDVVRGGKGAQDWIDGGPGEDRLAGGPGRYDAVRYIGAPKGVTVNLAQGSASGQGKDRVSGVSDVFGSPFADNLVGDDDKTGNGFFPGPGDDLIQGGEGVDLVLYSYSPTGVTVDVANGTASGQGSDEFAGVEGVRGSEFHDTISGDGAPNALYGGAGNDVVSGRDEDDFLNGGKGVDTLDGGPGTDVCVRGESVSNCDDSDTGAPSPPRADRGSGQAGRFGRVSCRWFASPHFGSDACASTALPSSYWSRPFS